MFDRFHQINRQKIEQQGAGVGLSIVQGVIHLHHGTVVCRSVEGGGSEFELSFPVLHV
jgi:signal transduction histidine kinase